MPNIEIDGKKVEVEQGMMIIEAADAHNIWIPRFCYHKKLTIAANCRMCLVEVEKQGKPLPACATPITDGMKVFTKSDKALKAQKSVMEFLLINHPLDCPICDQGGECELQDISMGYGSDVSRFTEKKRTIKDKNIGPLIATDMTRCIQCTRCVRFGSEIAGVRELGAVGRGEHMEIGTFIERNVESEVSGNIIDLCPVGALTSKPFRFKARGWELQQRPSIAPHDCIGSNIHVHLLRDKVLRVVPRENESVNEVWLSDRDRFSYEGLQVDRLEHPKIKRNGKFETVSWLEALEFASEKLKRVSKDGLGALFSPNCTTEEIYLTQKLIRGLGSNNIDHRLRQLDFRDQDLAPTFPNMGLPIEQLEHQTLVLLVGSLLRQEQPLLALKLRKGVAAAAKVMVINPIDCEFNFEVEKQIIVERGDLFTGFARVVKALFAAGASLKIPNEAKEWLQNIPEPSEKDQEMARELLNNIKANPEKSLILLGALALNHPDASRVIALANLMRELTGVKVGCLTEGANAAGAWIAGGVPHRKPFGQKTSQTGLNCREIFTTALATEQKAYLLLNIEPELDMVDSMAAMNALKQAESVIAITPYQSKSLESIAEILLPSTPFTETAGTFINAEGRWQSFKEVMKPCKESRPAWKILRVLGNLCDIEGFDYTTPEEIITALKQERTKELTLENWPFWRPEASREPKEQPQEKQAQEKDKQSLVRIAPVPLYATDNIVRRAASLQKTDAAKNITVALNPKTAERIGMSDAKRVQVATRKEAQKAVILPLILDDKVPENVAIIPEGVKETIGIAHPYQITTLSWVEGD